MRLDEAVAAKIGMRAGADYIVLGSLTKVGDYISLDARVISVTEDKPPLGVFTQTKGIDDVMAKIGDFAQDIGNKILGRRATAGRGTEGSRNPNIQKGISRTNKEGFKKSQTFPFEIKGLDIGDVDGDGRTNSSSSISETSTCSSMTEKNSPSSRRWRLRTITTS